MTSNREQQFGTWSKGERSMNRKRQSRSGAFTLVELMVVVVIIGILAALLSVAVYNAVVAARKTRIKAEIDNMHLAVERYATDHGEVPPCLADYLPTEVASNAKLKVREKRFIDHLHKGVSAIYGCPRHQHPAHLL